MRSDDRRRRACGRSCRAAARVGPTTRGHPGGREDLAERPDRAADVVADVRLVEPAAVVAHEVAHPAPRRRSRPGGTRASGRRSTSRPARRRGARARARRPRAARRRRRSSRSARFGITPFACWTIPTSSTSVSRWSVRIVDELRGRRPATGAAARRALDRLAQDRRGRLGDRRPRELRADPPRLGAGGGEPLGLLDVAGRRRRRAPPDRRTGRASPAPDASMSCAYQYGVETTPQPAAIANVSAPDAICSRLAVRRHEDVGRREQVGDLVDR